MALEFGEIEVAGGVHRHIAGGDQLDTGGASDIACAAAGHGSDDAIGADAPHAVVAVVGHVEVSRQVRSQAIGKVELGGRGRAAIAAETGHAGSRQGGDDAAGRDLTHAVVGGVGEVEIAQAVDGDALDGGKLSGGGRAAIAQVGASGDGFNAIGGGRGGGAPDGRGPCQRQQHTQMTSHRGIHGIGGGRVQEFSTTAEKKHVHQNLNFGVQNAFYTRCRGRMIRAALLASLLVGHLTWAQGVIRLKTRTIDTAQAASQGRLTGRPLPGGRHYLLQFPSYPGPDVREQLALRRIRVLQYVPDNTLMVLAGRGSNLEGLSVVWAGELEAEDKISPVLATHESNAFLVIFYPDVDMNLARAVAQLEGFEILENPELLPAQLLVTGAYNAIWGLAAWDQVSYIMPASTDLLAGTHVMACPGPSPKPDPSESTWRWGTAGPKTPAEASR